MSYADGPLVKTVLPRGSFNLHWFSLFNAISFQIMMGAPIIVYAKSLGASSTILGVIAAFTPLMTVFQLPAARHLDRFGYRQFVLMGWGMRIVLIFLVAGIPLAAFLDATSKLAALLALLFFFNLLRGISSAAWMPWIAHLIPAEVRGRFLSADQFFMYFGCLLSLFASALVISGPVTRWSYALVFLISAVGGAVSLAFIRRIPEVEAGEAMRLSSQNVPWRAMLIFRLFRLLVPWLCCHFAGTSWIRQAASRSCGWRSECSQLSLPDGDLLPRRSCLVRLCLWQLSTFWLAPHRLISISRMCALPWLRCPEWVPFTSLRCLP
jgi:MFS family permease